MYDKKTLKGAKYLTVHRRTQGTASPVVLSNPQRELFIGYHERQKKVDLQPSREINVP